MSAVLFFVHGAQGFQNSQMEAVRNYFSEVQIANKQVLVRDFLKYHADIIPAPMRPYYAKISEEYGNELLPQIELKKLEGSEGPQGIEWLIIHGGQSVSVRIYGTAEVFAKIGRETFTFEDLRNPSLFMEKVEKALADQKRISSQELIYHLLMPAAFAQESEPKWDCAELKKKGEAIATAEGLDCKPGLNLQIDCHDKADPSTIKTLYTCQCQIADREGKKYVPKIIGDATDPSKQKMTCAEVAKPKASEPSDKRKPSMTKKKPMPRWVVGVATGLVLGLFGFWVSKMMFKSTYNSYSSALSATTTTTVAPYTAPVPRKGTN